jgi:hypothetical protein
LGFAAVIGLAAAVIGVAALIPAAVLRWFVELRGINTDHSASDDQVISRERERERKRGRVVCRVQYP